MRFSDYQREAMKTDQLPLGQTEEERIRSLMIPLLGIAGEAGSLMNNFKRYLRDGDKYSLFNERISEELGDILWNVANLSTKFDLDLDEVALRNLKKIADRWIATPSKEVGILPFDSQYPEEERFPRSFAIRVRSEKSAGSRPRTWLELNGKPFGNDLTDNAEVDDGYRHHDVFHLAFMATLGWSPVLRGRPFFDCKRRSNRDTDEIEDGGRAAVIDEAIAALIFVEAKKNSFYEGVSSVEYWVLRTIKDLTAHLEVSRCSGRDWEFAIQTGFRVWRELRAHQEGWILGSLDERTLDFRSIIELEDLK